ncbi:MAG: hypothetical protein R3F56_16755 [Planctomycetota bacterium]
MSPSLPKSLALSVLLAASPAASQVRGNIPWPAQFAGGAFQQVVAGRFLPGPMTHAIVRREGALYLCYHPAAVASVSELSGPTMATGMVTVPPVAGSVVDSLLVSDATGAYLGSYVDPNQRFVFAQVAGAGWSNVHDVDRGPDGVGATLFAGIRDNEPSIRVARIDGAGVFVDLGAIALPTPALAVAVIDWDDDGAAEVAVLTGGGLLVCESDGAPAGQLAGSTGVGFVVTMRPAQGREQLAMLVPLPTADWLLVVADGRGVAESVVLRLSGLPSPLLVTGLQAADMDVDGDVDLLITQRSTHAALLLRNVNDGGSGRAFPPPAQPFVQPLLPASGDARLDEAGGVWVDFDHNGIPEGLFALDSEQALVMVGDLNGSARAQAPSWLQDAQYSSSDDKVILVLDSNRFGAVADVVVYVWHQPDVSGPVSANYRKHTIHAPLAHFLGGLRLDVPVFPQTPRSMFWAAGDHFYFDLQAFDAAGGMIGEEVLGVTMKRSLDDTTYLDYLLSLPVTPGYTSATIAVDPYMIAQVRRIGGIVTRRDIPPIEPDTVPQ